ncbi:MAG: hypothetical protein QF898_11305, partial [SAR202 cluster bacterium]|nr:hypothetical protein [SAR202 cluster bacterium]
NPPIENKLLKRLKIRRSTVEDAMATFSIYRGDTDQGVFLATPHIERYDGNASQRVNIPASGIPSWFGIAVVVDGVVKPGFDIHIGDVLSPGMYRVEVHILAAENEYKWEHRFIVQPHQPFVYWANL